MTPRGAALPLVVLSILLLAAGLASPQGNTTAPGDGGAGAGADNATASSGGEDVDYAVTLLPVEQPANSWSVTELHFPAGAAVRLIYDHANAALPHNLHVKGGTVDVATRCCLTGEPGREAVEFTMPESGELTYVCDVHPEMLGTITVGTFSTGGDAGGAAEGIEHVGVHYLAYWVAVIAFAVLFVVYGLTFFLFKHGESNATTDHMDRPGAASGDASGNRLRTLTVALVTVVIVVGGLVLAFVNMPAAG